MNLGWKITTIAGAPTGSAAAGSSNGFGTNARFTNPYGITSDGTNLYIADSVNNLIRKMVLATGEVSTLAGQVTQGDADGQGTAALFQIPMSITTDGKRLFVTDTANHKLRQIDIASGVVTTLAGPAAGCFPGCASGGADGTGNLASFNAPEGITTDGTYLFVSDPGNSKIRRIHIATRVVTTLAGNGTAGDADGPALSARFSTPRGITRDGTNLYIADASNNKIRLLQLATNTVTTIAGPSTGSAVAGDLDTVGNAARFNLPYGLTNDHKKLYIVDQTTNKLRTLDLASGAVLTVAGPAQGCSPGCASGDTDGTGNSVRFDGPASITTDGKRLFLVEFNNNKIRMIE